MFTTTTIGKDVPMGILGRLATALQSVFGPLTQQAARTSQVIQRTRKFTATTLAQTFTLGYLQHPNASDVQLAQLAVRAGVDVTDSAIEQRHTPQLVAFLKALFQGVAQLLVAADHALTPLLDRFTHVKLLDSTAVHLPPELASEYPGCGRDLGRSDQATLKLQTEWDLKTGVLQVDIENGRVPDNASARQHAEPVAGSLRIADLGYFALPVLQHIARKKAYFLSRLQFGTHLELPGNPTAQNAAQLLAWLSVCPGPFVEAVIRLGAESRLRCRLIAWRLPEERANRLRQQVRQDSLSKRKREPSAARLAWCDWTILVTNTTTQQLSAKESVVLYRARWQIELLFKRWKSLDWVATLSGATPVRQMVRVWGRLTAALLHHWLVVASTWHDVTRSWVKASEACRAFVSTILEALDDHASLVVVLQQLQRVVQKTCRRHRRRQVGTIELLENPELLDYFAT
jgi:hypothetical protein